MVSYLFLKSSLLFICLYLHATSLEKNNGFEKYTPLHKKKKDSCIMYPFPIDPFVHDFFLTNYFSIFKSLSIKNIFLALITPIISISSTRWINRCTCMSTKATRIFFSNLQKNSIISLHHLFISATCISFEVNHLFMKI